MRYNKFCLRILAVALSVLMCIPMLLSVAATETNSDYIELPSTDDPIEAEEVFDDTYDGYYDDYFDNYGFTDGDGNFNFAVTYLTDEECFDIANMYVKFSENPQLVEKHGEIDFETMISMYQNSSADNVETFFVEQFPLDPVDDSVVVASDDSTSWYHDTGTSLPSSAVYGATNLLGQARKGDIIYEMWYVKGSSTGSSSRVYEGNIGIVEGIFWDSTQSKFYVRLIEVLPNIGVCRSVLDETRLFEQCTFVFNVTATEAQKHTAVDFCIDQLGKAFSATGTPSYNPNHSAWYCAELIWGAYKYAGVSLYHTSSPSSIDPALLSRSSKLVQKEISTELPASLFVDSIPDWAESSIAYLANNGIMTGTSKSTFSSTASLTRAMFVTILYRLEGCPSVDATSDFPDVTNASHYYYNAVVWATDCGIVTGYTDGLFHPKAIVTREQLVTFLYRYADYLGCPMQYSTSALNSFTDANTVSAYAQIPMKWAITNGLITGIEPDILAPKYGARRHHTAVFVMRFIDNIM